MLTDLAAKKKQKLDWRKSIVDLMKLLDLDSSLAARKQLAKELNYSGDTNDSAAMNIWLHKQVMNKLAASGSKVLMTSGHRPLFADALRPGRPAIARSAR